ncbi:hypothetical protein EI94DRAFT_1052396 [Lactarius quietus]|nr:hypothetical protein EI94DRAFT_1052396 [Lactarius quietus]
MFSWVTVIQNVQKLQNRSIIKFSKADLRIIRDNQEEGGGGVSFSGRTSFLSSCHSFT